MTENKSNLAAYLAIHHHKDNLAMTFTNPDKKVRLLLSYVLFNIRQEMNRLTQMMYYRSVISQCHIEFDEIAKKHEADELNDEDTLRLTDLLLKKADLAHRRLLEVTNAPN